MIVYEFKQFGGQHTEVCALKNTLKQLAVVAPHTGQPYTEELLFGIGGGIGFAYFLFEKSGLHPIHLGTRIHTKETDKPDFLQMITSRIGARLRLQNSSSSTAAAANLKRQLADGHTPIVFVDPVRLPYLGLNAALHTYYSVVVCGIDEQADRVRPPPGAASATERARPLVLIHRSLA